jgi:hypothetical protein
VKLYIANIEDNDILTNYREIDLPSAIYIIMKGSNRTYSIVVNMINSLGIVYWYNDNYTNNYCVVNIEHHNLNFQSDYDINIYNQLKRFLRENKLKLLGI